MKNLDFLSAGRDKSSTLFCHLLKKKKKKEAFMLQWGSALGTDCQGIENKLLLIAETSFVQLDS